MNILDEMMAKYSRRDENGARILDLPTQELQDLWDELFSQLRQKDRKSGN